MGRHTLDTWVVEIDYKVGSTQHCKRAQHAEHVVSVVVVEENTLVVHGPGFLGRPERVVEIVFTVDPDCSTPGSQYDQTVYNSDLEKMFCQVRWFIGSMPGTRVGLEIIELKVRLHRSVIKWPLMRSRRNLIFEILNKLTRPLVPSPINQSFGFPPTTKRLLY